MTRIGLIGCGRAAELLYLPALKRIPSVEVAGLVDPIEQRRVLIGVHFPGCPLYDNPADLLTHAALDAVIISTPPDTHLQIVRACIEAGLGVLVEKPLAPSIKTDAELSELRGLIQVRNAVLMVGFNRRFWRPVQALRRAVAVSGQAAASGRLEFFTKPGAWQSVSHTSDPLDDLGSHLIDLAHFIFDDRTVAVSARWLGEHTIEFQLELSRGTVVECRAGYRDSYSEQYEIHFNGHSYRVRDGSERIEPAHGSFRKAVDLADRFLRRVKRQKSSFVRSYQAEIETFIQAVEQHQSPAPGIQAGIAALEVAQAARESAARDGKKIQLEKEMA